jgi:opacity protein-like surface antigen
MESAIGALMAEMSRAKTYQRKHSTNMLKLSSVSLAVMSFFAVASANAADLRDSLKDEPGIFVSKGGDFRGVYAGVGIGGEFANIEVGSFADGIGADGIVGDAVLGYDFRFGSFVFGPRIQGGITNVNTELLGVDALNLDGFVNFGGRAGVVFNRTLVYAHGGYEMMFASSDIPGIDSALDDADLNAVTVGLGLETAIADHVSLALEGAYVHGIDDADGVEAFRGMARINFRR